MYMTESLSKSSDKGAVCNGSIFDMSLSFIIIVIMAQSSSYEGDPRTYIW